MPSYCLKPRPMPFAESFTYTVSTDTHWLVASAHCLSVWSLPDVSSQYWPFVGFSGWPACEIAHRQRRPSTRHREMSMFVLSAALTVFSCPMYPLSE